MPFTYRRIKHLLFGRPLPSERLEHERLNRRTALAVLSSDAISSVAYATDQILIVLAVLGTAAAVQYAVPISGVIVGLLVLVGLSYRQTIFAYPNGGGSYTVAKENLGTGAGLVAAAALLTDYIMTVAVSIAGGIAAMTGTEAISNGVMAFKQPAQKNAAATLGTMVAILAAFFIGTSLLARHYGMMPTTTDTVLSQLADHIFGRGALYYVFQYSTF